MKNNNSTPGFSKFRELMELWDNHLVKEADETSIRTFLESNLFIMFFTYREKSPDGKIKTHYFATDEDNRIVFSRLKNPNKGEVLDKTEFFTAVDLIKALKSKEGLNSDNMATYSRGFGVKNLKNIYTYMLTVYSRTGKILRVLSH